MNNSQETSIILISAIFAFIMVAAVMAYSEAAYSPLHSLKIEQAAEIEANVVDIECTGRWIENIETLDREVAAWNKRRDDQEKKIDWKFTRGKADKKLSKH